MYPTKRLLDIFFAVFFLVFFSPIFLAIIFLIFFSMGRPILYWSERVGRNGTIFLMPKFRSMRKEAPTLASDLFENPHFFITPLGHYLRKSSLDELPQLWSVIKGEMSLVGPRPALFNQVELIDQRALAGIDKLLPGLTGWAQINGRDTITLKEKLRFDEEYLNRQSAVFDIYILWLTAVKVFTKDGISH